MCIGFFTVVLIPPSSGRKLAQVKQKVGELLAPYYYEKMVPEYEEPCLCIGLNAITDAREQAKFQVAEIAELLHEYVFTSHDSRPAIVDRLRMAERIEQECLKRHPLRHDPDPECSICNGTGRHRSTQNPIGRWERWMIGGKYNGIVRDVSFPSVAGNVVDALGYLEAIDAYYAPYPFAMVSPDGSWHRPNVGNWFFDDGGRTETWEQRARSILEANKECLAVGIECQVLTNIGSNTLCAQDYRRSSNHP